jgi:exodeoxyribonuclease VII large subunit
MTNGMSEHRDIFSVSRLNAEVRAVLDGSFPLLWVEGEISNLAAPRSGHLYFSLKDAHAQVRCAMFRNRRVLLRQQPANGDQVLLRARVSLFEPRGDFQLIVEHLEPAGAGSAQRAFEALKARLQQEGLFDAALKRELPAFPHHLGVITSPSGAAIRDVLKVLKRRAPHLRVTIYPSQVQGEGATEELRETLALALERAECDVLLLTRGGGSIEDLAAFNDEILARTIAAAEIPVVSAVGHEVDFTITDFVADRRAPTPSAAAELISPDGQALRTRLDRHHRRLRAAIRRQTGTQAQLLARLQGRLERASPRNRLRQQQQRLDAADLRLVRALRRQLLGRREGLEALQRQLRSHSPAQRLTLLRQRLTALAGGLFQAWQTTQRERRQHLAATARELNAVSPLATLERGYAVLRQAQLEGQPVVRSVLQVNRQERLVALLPDGSLELSVLERQAAQKPSDTPE